MAEIYRARMGNPVSPDEGAPPKKQEPEEKAPSNLQDVLKSRQVQKEYEAGEKARKEGMGKTFKKGGSVSSASRRADDIASKGKTKGRMI